MSKVLDKYVNVLDVPGYVLEAAFLPSLPPSMHQKNLFPYKLP